VEAKKLKLNIAWYYTWGWFFVFTFMIAIILSVGTAMLLPNFVTTIWGPISAGVIGFILGLLWAIGRNRNITKLKKEMLNKLNNIIEEAKQNG
jgi:hypothetical protein